MKSAVPSRSITRWGLSPSFLDRAGTLPLPGSLLVIGPIGLGDTVLALPALRRLQQASPTTRITWIGAAGHEAVLRLAGVDDFVPSTLQSDADDRPLSSLDGFDAVLTFRDVDVDALGPTLPLDAIPMRIGAANGLRKRWCNHLVHTKRLGFPRHEALRNLRLLLPFGLHQPRSFDAVSALGRLEHQRSALPPDLGLRGRYVVLHAYSAGHAREWPVDHWRRLASVLAAESITPVLTGSAKDAQALRNAWPLHERPASLIDTCGRLDLSQLVTLLADATAMVACSTGPLHLAASFGTPSIGLFVPRKGLGPDRWSPLGPTASALLAHRRCPRMRSCDPSSCRCIRDLSVDQVSRALRPHMRVAPERAASSLPWLENDDRSPA